MEQRIPPDLLCVGMRQLFENCGLRGKPGLSLYSGWLEDGPHPGCPYVRFEIADHNDPDERLVLLMVWLPSGVMELIVNPIDDSGSET